MIKIVLLLAAAVLLSSMIVIYFGCIFRRYKVVEHKDISAGSYFKLYKKGFFSYKPFYIPVKDVKGNRLDVEGSYIPSDIHSEFSKIHMGFFSIDDALRACKHCAHGKTKYKGCDIFPIIGLGEEIKTLFACSIYSILTNGTYVYVTTKDSCKKLIDIRVKENSVISERLKFRKETVVKLGLKQRIKDFISK